MFIIVDAAFFSQCVMAEPCDDLAACVNTVGSFMCGLCPPGYEGSYEAEAGLEFARNNKQVQLSSAGIIREGLAVHTSLLVCF